MADSGKESTSFMEPEIRSILDSVISSNKPNTEQDLLCLVTHAVLLQNGFKAVCVGRYDGNSPNGLEGTALPDQWNKQDPDCYEFTYLKTDSQNMYTLRALPIEDKLCFNLLKKGESQGNAGEVQIATADHIDRQQRPINIEWLNELGFLWKKIERGLLGKHQDLFERRDYELHSKLLEQERPRQRDNRPQPVLHDGVPVHPLQAHQPSPFAYGDADLFPGHPGQGGMIMDPFRSGGMGLRPPMHPGVPRGSVPPGARFDPFGPLTEFDHSTGSRRPPRSFDPNPDHLQRPGFNDDMYM